MCGINQRKNGENNTVGVGMITRGLVLRAMAAIASMLPAQSPAANRSPKDRDCSAILPMERCGGGFCEDQANGATDSDGDGCDYYLTN